MTVSIPKMRITDSRLWTKYLRRPDLLVVRRPPLRRNNLVRTNITFAVIQLRRKAEAHVYTVHAAEIPSRRDMQCYHTILAGASWVAEYGNPDTDDWTFLKQYSPNYSERMKKIKEIWHHTCFYDARLPLLPA